MLAFLLAVAQVEFSRTPQALAEDLAHLLASDTQFGCSIAPYGDWDSDGHDDFLVSAPREWSRSAGSRGRARVLLVSGRDAKLLLVARYSESWWGSRLSALDDIDGDGAREILVGGWSVGWFVLSPRAGTVVHEFSVATGHGKDVRVERIGDANGDGVDDIALLEHETIRVLDAKTALPIGPALPGRANAMIGVPDVDGDRVADFVAMARLTPAHVSPSRWDLRVLSMAKRSTVSFRTIEHAAANFDLELALMEDPQRTPRLAIGIHGGPGREKRSCVEVLGLPGLCVELTLEDELAGTAFGWALSGCGDVDGDGRSDVLVAQVATFFDQGCWGGGFVFSGADGKRLRTHDGDSSSGDPFTSVAAIGDVDADGVSDYAFGAATLQSTACIGTYVEVRSGATGAPIFTLPRKWTEDATRRDASRDDRDR
jgi:hypothetical protein